VNIAVLWVAACAGLPSGADRPLPLQLKKGAKTSKLHHVVCVALVQSKFIQPLSLYLELECVTRGYISRNVFKYTLGRQVSRLHHRKNPVHSIECQR